MVRLGGSCTRKIRFCEVAALGMRELNAGTDGSRGDVYPKV